MNETDLNQRLAEASEELRQASIELNEASHRYNQAILARIAIREQQQNER